MKEHKYYFITFDITLRSKYYVFDISFCNVFEISMTREIKEEDIVHENKFDFKFIRFSIQFEDKFFCCNTSFILVQLNAIL